MYENFNKKLKALHQLFVSKSLKLNNMELIKDNFILPEKCYIRVGSNFAKIDGRKFINYKLQKSNSEDKSTEHRNMIILSVLCKAGIILFNYSQMAEREMHILGT